MRGPLRFDPVCLGAGAALILVGVLIVLDSAGTLSVPPGWMAVALTAAVGAILLLSGLVGDDSKRQD